MRRAPAAKSALPYFLFRSPAFLRKNWSLIYPSSFINLMQSRLRLVVRCAAAAGHDRAVVTLRFPRHRTPYRLLSRIAHGFECDDQ